MWHDGVGLWFLVNGDGSDGGNPVCDDGYECNIK